jgi:hypothetical protein
MSTEFKSVSRTAIQKLLGVGVGALNTRISGTEGMEFLNSVLQHTSSGTAGQITCVE